MSHNDLKIYALNSVVMAISFSNVEAILKIILLSASIIYTFIKIIQASKGKDESTK